MNHKDDEMTHTRADDPPIKITREIPLHWLVSLVLAFFVQAAIIYFGQQRQGELIQLQSETIKELSQKLSNLGEQFNNSAVKNVEQDLKLTDHERRITAIETRR